MTQSLQQDRGGSSLAELAAAAPQEAPVRPFSAATWANIALLAGLFAAMHWWVYGPLYIKWQDPNWTHGYLIPLFSLYLLYSRRNEIFSVPRRPFLPALAVMLAAIGMEIVGYLAISIYIAQLSILLLLLALVLYLNGWPMLRLTWLPILFLIFAIPIPDLLYTRIAMPLQNLAAKSSDVLLRMCGVNIDANASMLTIVSMSGRNYEVAVAEACSGVRSLMAFMALGVAWAYLEYRPVWQRIVLVAAAVPVAVLCNIIRVTGTCEMYVLDKPELGSGFMHEFMGMVMLIPALGMLWLLSRILQGLLVEVEEDDTPAARGPDEPLPQRAS